MRIRTEASFPYLNIRRDDYAIMTLRAVQIRGKFFQLSRNDSDAVAHDEIS